MGSNFDFFNGKSFFLEEAWATLCQLHFYLDAVKSKGFGIIFGGHWAYGEWPGNYKIKREISSLELFSHCGWVALVVSYP